jgi:hypothetical protein
MMSLSRSCRMIHSSRIARVASPWGNETWRNDASAFIAFCEQASADSPSEAKRQWNGYLMMAFGDVDSSKTGKINAEQFDILCESIARLPRRFGMAPSWQIEYGGDKAKRTAARKAMFDNIDKEWRHEPQGWIGAAQFIDWATKHVAAKVKTSKSLKVVDFYHVDNYNQEDFLVAIDNAVNKPDSADATRLYEFLMTIYVEEDHACKGVVTLDGFQRLVNRAALVPREFGLAPSVVDEARVRELYASMEDPKMGGVTFRTFLAWTREHLKMKVNAGGH